MAKNSEILEVFSSIVRSNISNNTAVLFHYSSFFLCLMLLFVLLLRQILLGKFQIQVHLCSFYYYTHVGKVKLVIRKNVTRREYILYGQHLQGFLSFMLSWEQFLTFRSFSSTSALIISLHIWTPKHLPDGFYLSLIFAHL